MRKYFKTDSVKLKVEYIKWIKLNLVKNILRYIIWLIVEYII